MIPKILHFIHILAAGPARIEFGFAHYLAVRSAALSNPDCAVMLHVQEVPVGPYWQAAAALARVNRVEAPTQVHGRPLLHVAHQVDVLRLQILQQHGGVYLDIDTITRRAYAPLLDCDFVIAMLRHERGQSLCNGVLMAPPGSPWIAAWLDAYRSFRSRGRDAWWDEHSVQVPTRLFASFIAPEVAGNGDGDGDGNGNGQFDRAHYPAPVDWGAPAVAGPCGPPGTAGSRVRVLPPAACCLPSYDAAGLAELYGAGQSIDPLPADAFCHQLWQSAAGPLLADVNEATVFLRDSPFNRLARACLSAQDLAWFRAERARRQARLMQAPIRLTVGSTDRPALEWINLDDNAWRAPDVLCDYGSQAWPLPDHSVGEVRLVHCIERTADPRHFFRELYRVCRPGAHIAGSVYHPRHDVFLADPRHRTAVVPETLQALDRRQVMAWMMAGALWPPLARDWEVDFELTSMVLRVDAEFAQAAADAHANANGNANAKGDAHANESSRRSAPASSALASTADSTLSPALESNLSSPLNEAELRARGNAIATIDFVLRARKS